MSKPTSRDPYLWLEATDSARALRWVRRRNAETERALARTREFKRLQRGLREILDSSEHIPHVAERAGFLYNFWEDRKHPRGLWRRTTLADYAKPKPRWDVILDLAALGKAEGESWVWAGVDSLPPDHRRCLLSLSRAGADATVVREFDITERKFIDDGFALPEAKHHLGWIDEDAVYVGTDFGPGSMTTSGYPRLAKLWRRGTPLSKAEEIFAGRAGDVSVSAVHDPMPGFERDWVYRTISFYKNEVFLRGASGKLGRLDVPLDAEVSSWREWLLVAPRTEWKLGRRRFAAGTQLAIRLDAFLAGERNFDVLFEPTPQRSLTSVVSTRGALLFNLLDDVAGRVEVLTPRAKGWKRKPLGGAPALSNVEATPVDRCNSDEVWLHSSSFLTPSTLARGTPQKGAFTPLKQEPHFFDSKRLEVTQAFATSDDGTRIPYFMVAPKKRGKGPRATLLYGYGGFEVSLQPGYSPGVGRAWLEPGGVYVLANIRGGREYGPAWHQAALKEKRPRAYEDFAAVARDLIARGITSPEHLVAQGGSNGGLLVANMLTRCPTLFAGILCEVPLLDMERYTQLSAGASWVAEYGDPKVPKEWKHLVGISPYHQVRSYGRYPPVLFTTSTRDDRVGPAHARKMAARMKEQGHRAWLYENMEGGHGAAADHGQKAFVSALGYSFLWTCVRGAGFDR